MNQNGTIIMAMRELNRLKVIQAVIDGILKPSRAAEQLGLTDRQIRRLVNRVSAEGPSGIVSRRHGKPSNHRLSPDIAATALRLIRNRYSDFGPTLACVASWQTLAFGFLANYARRPSINHALDGTVWAN